MYHIAMSTVTPILPVAAQTVPPAERSQREKILPIKSMFFYNN